MSSLRKGDCKTFFFPRSPLIRKLYLYICRFVDDGYGMGLKLQIAPNDLVNGRRVAELYDCTHDSLQLFKSAFTDIINDYFATVSPDIDDWSLQNIEYSINLRTDNKALLLKMLDKSAKSTKCRTYKKDNAYTGTRKSNKSGQGRSLTAYDKAKQMQDVHPDVLEQSQDDYDFIRVELRIDHKALRPVQKQYCIHRTTDWLNYDIAVSELNKEYRRTYPVGDFMSKRQMHKALQQTDYSPRVQQSLLDFSTWLARRKSAKTAKIRAKQSDTISYTTAAINRHIGQFNAVFINPIPIPRDDKIKYLPNPIPDEFLTDDEYNERERLRMQWNVS